jgi:hypothetical protein
MQIGIRRGLAALVLACSALLVMAVPSAFGAQQVITSAGPLNNIYLNDNLGCQVDHTGDIAHEFFGGSDPGACGTFLHTGGTVYGPTVPAGDPRTPYTLVSQTGVTGSGTSADPFKVVTVVDVGSTGLRITQTDSYVVGDEFYRSDIAVSNSTGSAIDAALYHAGDCFLQESDEGFGFDDTASGGGIYCSINANNSPPDRIEGFVPLSAGSHHVEVDWPTIWHLIAGPQFPDSCECNIFQDNGAGLSWSLSVPANGSVTRSLLSTFSPTGVTPPVETLTLAPATASNPIGTPHTVTATLTSDGTPVAGATIRFSAAGANSASGSGTTNASGEATFTYTGLAAGGDSIIACDDKNTNGSCDPGEATATAEKTWTGAPVGAQGRMTGGGTIVGTRVHHGFELNCDTTKSPNNLEVNWGHGNRFHLGSLTSADCSNDPSISEGHPVAGFDTHKGSGTGTYNGTPGATAEWTMTDAGEPGRNDAFRIKITNAGNAVVLDVSGKIQGNHQAHAD